MKKSYELLVMAGIVIAMIAVFIQVGTYDFVQIDDNSYVCYNPHVNTGLTLENIKFVFLNAWAANWHPLTYISHMVDVELFGLNSAYHHLMNLLFHILNTLILLAACHRLTGDYWKSVVVALLFAFHPTHVESVAWVSERKDVLSTFFFLLTIFFYDRLVKKRNFLNHIAVLLCLILGLLSKPMVITLPFVLVLLDFWPLCRIQSVKDFFSVIKEKTLYFLLVFISAGITFFAQRDYGAMVTDGNLPLIFRIENAVQAYVKYIGKLFYPVNLSVIYPIEQDLNISFTLFSLVLLSVITFFSIREYKRHPYFIMGWLWFLGTLVPVIGIVQVGSQSMADRYTYIPFIGLFIMLAWGVPDYLSRYFGKARYAPYIATISILICSILTNRHLNVFSNSLTLFSNAVSTTKNNYIGHYQLSTAYLNVGEIDKAIEHCHISLAIKKNQPAVYSTLGEIAFQESEYEKAAANLRKAIDLSPTFKGAHFMLARTYVKLGEIKKAIWHFQNVYKIYPKYHDMLSNYGAKLVKNGEHRKTAIYLRNKFLIETVISEEKAPVEPDFLEGSKIFQEGIDLLKAGKTARALNFFNRVLDTQFYPKALFNNFGVANIIQNRWENADRYFEKAIELDPDFSQAYNNYGVMFFYSGDMENALSYFKHAIEIKKSPTYYNNLGLIFVQMEDFENALNAHLKAFELAPENAKTSYLIASVYAAKRENKPSVSWLKKAISLGFPGEVILENDIFFNELKNDPEFPNVPVLTL